MSESDARLEKCLRRITVVGRSQGSVITYDAVKEQLNASGIALSLDTLDRVYDYLKSNGVKLTDEIPANTAPCEVHDERRSAASLASGKVGDESEYHIILPCVEAAIDRLVATATEGVVDLNAFTEMLEVCRLSEIDVQQLIEYLQGWGFDTPPIDTVSSWNIEHENADYSRWTGEDSIARIVSHSGRITYPR